MTFWNSKLISHTGWIRRNNFCQATVELYKNFFLLVVCQRLYIWRLCEKIRMTTFSKIVFSQAHTKQRKELETGLVGGLTHPILLGERADSRVALKTFVVRTSKPKTQIIAASRLIHTVHVQSLPMYCTVTSLVLCWVQFFSTLAL